MDFFYLFSDLGWGFIFQPGSKKAASIKSGVNKKCDGSGQAKLSKPVETEDVEVNYPFFDSLTIRMCNWYSALHCCTHLIESRGLHVQPAEMSLEEIEGKLGSLIHADTISQLKSAVWKERLEGTWFLF